VTEDPHIIHPTTPTAIPPRSSKRDPPMINGQTSLFSLIAGVWPKKGGTVLPETGVDRTMVGIIP
jgi:hypothetical protein